MAERLPLEGYISPDNLVTFLKAMFAEEERCGRSVPTTETRRLLVLRTHTSGTSDTSMDRILRLMVEKKYLREDRKDLRINLVGYFTTTEAHDLVHANQAGPILVEEQDLPLHQITKLARGTNIVAAKQRRSDEATVVIEAPKPDEEATRRLNNFLRSKVEIGERLTSVNKRLTSSQNLPQLGRVANPKTVRSLELQARILQDQLEEVEARITAIMQSNSQKSQGD